MLASLPAGTDREDAMADAGKTHLAPDLLAGKSILITGGGTGLGLAMGLAFAGLGAEIDICGRRAEVLEEAAAKLREAGAPRVGVHPCDIRDADAVEAMMAAVFETRAPDVLVNNAAATFIARTHTLSARAVDAILAPTLHGTVYCTLAAGRRWIAAGRPATVLSILSTSTITGRAFAVPSAIAKTGVLAMTKSLAVEWGRHGIRLVALAPGNFPTEGATGQLRPAARGAGRMAPLGRNGDRRELAEVAAFLVSDAAAYMTGEMLVLDGGLHLTGSGAEDLLDWTDAQWEALRPAR